MTEILYKELSYSIIGVAMEVHRKLGPGLKEFKYHQAMLEKFRAAGILGRSKAKGKLIHNGQFADGFEADFLIKDSIVLELKHLDGSFSAEHFLQIISYQKHWNCLLGMLIDFGKESLVFERVVYTSPNVSIEPQQLFHQQPELPEDLDVFNCICGSLCQLLRVHGLGYRDTTYKSLVRIDLRCHKLVVHSGTATIRIDQTSLGDADLPCFVVNDRSAVRVVALQNELRAADRAIVQTCLKHLGLRWGLLVNFGKNEFQSLYVSIK